MAITDVLTETRDKMGKAVEVAKDDFNTVRTGRINPALFQKIPVDYYGTPTPLAQLASLQAPEARTLIVTPYDKTALKEIERAIATFPNLGASPTNDGTIVRVTIPELTRTVARSSSRSSRRRARTPRSRSATSAAAPRTTSTLRTRSAKTRSLAPRRSSRPSPRATSTPIDEALKKKEAELLEV